ncbi:septal ring lytic transglycosylase RlpA family protein [Reichenbachiella sp. MALMAid0571]|uniref:septal ring lytic transglycosylase RlpA family protein n=1 Tax=Reichenbachiella sp. MALMAid0571 TaxID=3143939 RepID=UPI0032DE8A81
MKYYLPFLLCLSFLTSCSAVKTVPANKAIIGKKIESGIASWYGPGFHGKKTANGETFDMNALTAAHRTLPFNTLVKVVNLNNGLSVTVRINDRGPYAKNRVIDLSKKAAGKLRMIESGTANIELILLKSDREISKKLTTPHYAIQIGSYASKSSAIRKQSEVKGARIEEVFIEGQLIHRVYVGLFTDEKEAHKMNKIMASEGIQGFVKQIEN